MIYIIIINNIIFYAMVFAIINSTYTYPDMFLIEQWNTYLPIVL